MKMDHTAAESKASAAAQEAPSFLDRMLAGADEQINLCIAARLIFENSDRLRGMSAVPEILALQGIISAISKRAEGIAEELEITDIEEALQCFRR